MCKKCVLIAVFLMLASVPSVNGQGRSRLEIAWERLGIDPDAQPKCEAVLQHIEGVLPGFRVTIDFHVLPQPLKVARATVTLTADADLPPNVAHDWQLGFDTSERQVKWLSDKFFDIPGHIKVGDVYTIPVEFIVLESGQFGFAMYWTNFSRTADQLPIQWCINRDGELTYLGNAARYRLNCDADWYTFFNEDSIRVIYKAHGEVGYDMFTGYCKIVPPFKIGEPSSVCFRITFVENHPDGVDLEFSYGHTDVSDYPGALNGPLYAGDSVELCVTAVPLPNREKHDIALSVYDESMSPTKEYILLTFVFNDDGSLRYIKNGYIDPEDKDDEYLPKSFPKGTKATCGSHWVKRTK